MVFSTVEFIFIFLPVFLILYFLVPVQYRNLLLFAGSVVFYAAGTLDKPVYILILLLSVIVNFALGRMIQDSSKPKRILTAGIIYNLAWLVIFKYADFIIIDRDIFNINPIDIENTKVLQTFFNGKLVYDIKQNKR